MGIKLNKEYPGFEFGEVFIEFESRMFLPGQVVSGIAHVHVKKDIYPAKQVKLIFYCKESSGKFVGDGGFTNRKQIHFKQVHVLENIQQQFLTQGYYEYPFSITIPKDSISSLAFLQNKFSSQYIMRIYYSAKVIVEDFTSLSEGRKPPIKGKRHIIVANYNHEESIPEVYKFKPSLYQNKIETYLTRPENNCMKIEQDFKGGKFQMEVSTNKVFYEHDDQINLKLKINNRESNQFLDDIKVELKHHNVLANFKHAEGDDKRKLISKVFPVKLGKEYQEKDLTIDLKEYKPDPINEKECGELLLRFAVPEVTPEERTLMKSTYQQSVKTQFSCIQYYLKIELHFKGFMKKKALIPPVKYQIGINPPRFCQLTIDYKNETQRFLQRKQMEEQRQMRQAQIQQQQQMPYYMKEQSSFQQQQQFRPPQQQMNPLPSSDDIFISNMQHDQNILAQQAKELEYYQNLSKSQNPQQLQQVPQSPANQPYAQAPSTFSNQPPPPQYNQAYIQPPPQQMGQAPPPQQINQPPPQNYGGYNQFQTQAPPVQQVQQQMNQMNLGYNPNQTYATAQPQVPPEKQPASMYQPPPPGQYQQNQPGYVAQPPYGQPMQNQPPPQMQPPQQYQMGEQYGQPQVSYGSNPQPLERQPSQAQPFLNQPPPTQWQQVPNQQYNPQYPGYQDFQNPPPPQYPPPQQNFQPNNMS